MSAPAGMRPLPGQMVEAAGGAFPFGHRAGPAATLACPGGVDARQALAGEARIDIVRGCQWLGGKLRPALAAEPLARNDGRRSVKRRAQAVGRSPRSAALDRSAARRMRGDGPGAGRRGMMPASRHRHHTGIVQVLTWLRPAWCKPTCGGSRAVVAGAFHPPRYRGSSSCLCGARRQWAQTCSWRPSRTRSYARTATTLSRSWLMAVVLHPCAGKSPPLRERPLRPAAFQGCWRAGRMVGATTAPRVAQATPTSRGNPDRDALLRDPGTKHAHTVMQRYFRVKRNLSVARAQ